ncbi:MAG: TraR/DksA family transcriptional regulator [Lentisphaeria bacterium]|nr:TraR/DksA family transcriptional regulator [Lentisphaeria bacterium]
MSKKKTVVPSFKGIDKERYDRLIAAREAVLQQINYHTESALDCNNMDKRGVTTHMADVSGDNSRHEMQLKLLTEDGNVLELIEGAIKRLIDGTYGKCLDCGQPISEARLEVRPHAIYCVKCKSLREQNNRL